jgi:ankyrin repeat protein
MRTSALKPAVAGLVFHPFNHSPLKLYNYQQVDKLIEMKANVNCPDFSGKQPLHVAVVHGHKDIAKLLLDNKAGLKIKLCLTKNCVFIDCISH